MEIIDREVSISHVPQDVQSAIDTILSWGYAVQLENQILRHRLEEIRMSTSESEINEAIKTTHRNTKVATAERMRVMITRTEAEEGAGK